MTNRFGLTASLGTHLLNWMADRGSDSARASVHCHDDPPSGIRMVEVYTDDGEGNGECVVAIPLSVLLKAVADWNTAQD